MTEALNALIIYYYTFNSFSILLPRPQKNFNFANYSKAICNDDQNKYKLLAILTKLHNEIKCFCLLNKSVCFN